MPPRTGRRAGVASVPELADAVVAQWRHIADAVDALPAGLPAAASLLPGQPNGDLVMYLARSATAVTQALDATIPGSVAARPARLVAATEYLVGSGAAILGAPEPVPGAAGAAGPGGWLRAEALAAGAALARLATPVSTTRAEPEPVVAGPGGPMAVSELLRARAVEAVLHGLDLGVEPLRPALRVATRLIVELFVVRAPGHAVELRVPPFAAVQVVAGPRHTRGTPPNVVEAGPVPFLLVCAGRLGWAEAVADGRITASGERADLRAYLPLLGSGAGRTRT